MRVAVVGDIMADIEIAGNGGWDGACPENPQVVLFKGCKANVLAGGAGNVAYILSEQHCTVDLYVDGPGQKDKAWIGELLKRTLRCNRVHWSGEGNPCLKLRGLCNNQVQVRIDCDEIVQRKQRFVALEALADDCGRYEVVLFADYCKGLVCPETEEIIRKIIRNAKVCIVDSKRLDYSIWHGATAVVPNAAEAARIYSTADPMEVVQKAGAKYCYITRSGKSILFSDGKGTSEIELEKHVDAPYNVGAGDAFAAGLALALGHGESPFCAGQSAMRMAQQYVSKSRKCQLR